MKSRSQHSNIFFNASVILAGLASPTGGSAKLLQLVVSKEIQGIVSEIIINEATRHANKIKHSPKHIETYIQKYFSVWPAPKKSKVEKYYDVVIDAGDAHVLASCSELKVDYLVSLDKKHLLILQKEIKAFKIVSPKKLLEILSR